MRIVYYATAMFIFVNDKQYVHSEDWTTAEMLGSLETSVNYHVEPNRALRSNEASSAKCSASTKEIMPSAKASVALPPNGAKKPSVHGGKARPKNAQFRHVATHSRKFVPMGVNNDHPSSAQTPQLPTPITDTSPLPNLPNHPLP